MTALWNWLWSAPPAENMVARPRLRSREREVQRIARTMTSESPPPERVVLWARDEYQGRMREQQWEREFAGELKIMEIRAQRSGEVSALARVREKLTEFKRHNENPRAGDWYYREEDVFAFLDDSLAFVAGEMKRLSGEDGSRSAPSDQGVRAYCRYPLDQPERVSRMRAGERHQDTSQPESPEETKPS